MCSSGVCQRETTVNHGQRGALSGRTLVPIPPVVADPGWLVVDTTATPPEVRHSCCRHLSYTLAAVPAYNVLLAGEATVDPFAGHRRYGQIRINVLFYQTVTECFAMRPRKGAR